MVVSPTGWLFFVITDFVQQLPGTILTCCWNQQTASEIRIWHNVWPYNQEAPFAVRLFY